MLSAFVLVHSDIRCLVVLRLCMALCNWAPRLQGVRVGSDACPSRTKLLVVLHLPSKGERRLRVNFP
jgi:hypothetical protein